MPEYIDENLDLGTDQDNDSDLVRSLRKQLREASKARDAAVKEVETFRATSRQSELSKLLADARVLNPEKAVRFVPADLEVSKEAIEQWLKGDGDVFPTAPDDGKSAEQAPVQSTEQRPSTQQETPNTTPDFAAQWAAIQQSEQRGTAGPTPIGGAAIAAGIDSLRNNQNASFEDAIAAFAAIGERPIA